MITHSFTAYPSGDGGCFYFSVPLDEAKALGIDADLLDPCRHHAGCVKVYPDYLFKGQQALRFEITTTETPLYTLSTQTSNTAITNASTGRLDV